MNRVFLASALALCLSAIGCVSGNTARGLAVRPPDGHPRAEPDNENTSSKSAAAFQAALADMAALDRKEGWSAADCERVAGEFLAAAGDGRDERSAMSLFNAGVAYERCGRDSDAEERFNGALRIKAGFHPAEVHLILIRHRRSGGKDIDRTIADLRRVAIVDARYQNVEALVALAMLSLERGNSVADTDGESDRARAVRYLQSALAVDDGYSPAMNGLALYYLGEARATSGRKVVKSSTGVGATFDGRGTQAMELAALVCTQAIRRTPADAVLHNTLGLIQVELGNLGKAAEAFGKARSLRPGFYEAEMNFAAVNLQFRGFANAEQAYRAVLQKRPDDYDARVGLALALRGQIGPDTPESLIVEADKELQKAKKISPDRPEAYYNQAILTEEYKARTQAPPEAMKTLFAAQDLFRQFIQKAGTAPELADTVKRAGERIREIDQMIEFVSKTPEKSG